MDKHVALFEKARVLIDSPDALKCHVRKHPGDTWYKDIQLQRAGVHLVLSATLELRLLDDPQSKLGSALFVRNNMEDTAKPQYAELLTRVITLIDAQQWGTLLAEYLMVDESAIYEMVQENGNRKRLSCFVNIDEGFVVWYAAAERQYKMAVHYFNVVNPIIIELQREKAEAIYLLAKRVFQQRVHDAQEHLSHLTAFLAEEDRELDCLSE